MPFLLVRDGKLVVQDTRLARESCTQCCEGSEPLWFEVADCCYPDESFWILTTQQGRGEQGLQPIYTPGVPVTIKVGPYCATTRPDVALTYDEIIALDPDANFALWPPGFEPEIEDGCNSPRCAPCPQCCAVKHLSENECGGPLCCEHGGSFTVSIGITATYQQYVRLYGWRGPIDCIDCFKYSAEAQSASGVSSYFLGVRFECGPDGNYTGTCLGGSVRRTLLNWGVDGPENHGCGLDDGFLPTRTLLPINENINSDGQEVFECAEASPSLFATRWADMLRLVPSLFHVTYAGRGVYPSGTRFGVDCFGSANETDPIDRSWTTDPCEARLSALGDVRQLTRTWNGSQNCDGGEFVYDGSYEAGFTTRFVGSGGWGGWVSRELLRVQATWSIDKAGTSTCLEPQCVGNPGGLPPLLFDRRAAVPAVKQSEARKGCSSCGKGEGL
jgi:hypothetical protein